MPPAAEANGKPGQWAIKNTRSSAQPVLQGATNRALREKVWKAFVSRGDNGNANDTNATIAEILKLRQQRAELLGFATHANYRMADTMAKTPENAMGLMMKVWPAAVARVKEEVADMQAIADQEAKAGDGPKIAIEPWDYRFYSEKVRKAKYDLDESEVKPYLQLDKLTQAMFWSAGQLYDLGFRENTGAVPVFDPKVKTFEVYNLKTNENVGLIYLDNFARDGKRSGAWMTTYRSQQTLGGERNVLASNNNNFTEAAKGEPTLISLDDATTLFHEFGHGIHYLLQHINYPALGGVPRDFVEFPSQVNENWLMTPEVLSKYATHYKTGAPIPQALVDKILASNKFNQGFETVEYLSSAIVDMKIHDRKVPVTDVDKFERETLAEMGMPKEIVMRHRLPQFGHLFSSDAYSAGYYSYLWSETMDADTLGRLHRSRRSVGPHRRGQVPHHPADDRQRDRPRRRISRLPWPRSRCEGTAQEARLSDRIDIGDRGGKGGGRFRPPLFWAPGDGRFRPGVAVDHPPLWRSHGRAPAPEGFRSRGSLHHRLRRRIPAPSPASTTGRNVTAASHPEAEGASF